MIVKKGFFMAEKIINDIFWIGVDNPYSRDFHGIASPRGGSYNSYLVFDTMPTIVDATNKLFFNTYMESLKSLIKPSTIKYIIVNHAENDHAGALKELLVFCKGAKVVCTKRCSEFLKNAFGVECEFMIVKSNDELNIGNKTFKFFVDPMVHWPETMITYLKEEKIVFTGDLFGTEVSHEEIFADEMKNLKGLRSDYFTLIMRPYFKNVKLAVNIVKNLDLEYIAPSHGPVYRKDLNAVIDHYEKLIDNPEEDKVLIVYASIWGSTGTMAKEIAKEVKEADFEAVVHDISKSNFVELMEQAMTSKIVVLGSLTMNSSFHPLFETLFRFLELNNQPEKISAVFGTHGWGPMAVPNLKARLEGLKYKVVDELDFNFGPKSDDDFSRLKDFGRNLVSLCKDQ